MVKSIINVRRSSICWRGRRGTDNGRQKTRNHGYDVIVGGELFTDYSDHPRKLVTLNPKLKLNDWDATSFFPVGGMPTASSLAWRLLSEKSGRCGIAAVKRRGALPVWLIVVISVRQSTVAAMSDYRTMTLVMVSSGIRLTAWLQNSKRAERSEEIDVWASHRDYPRSGYHHHRLPVAGC